MSDILSDMRARLDEYSRTAQLAPGLLLLLAPAATAIGAGAAEWPAVTGLTGAAVVMGLPIALAEWIRRRGQRLQTELWNAWGGNPVVSSLRADGLIAERRRQALAQATGLPVNDLTHPEFEEVANNAVKQLITRIRAVSQSYPLVFKENKAYGFARNLYASRRIGLRSSGVTIVAGGVLMVASTHYAPIHTVGTGIGTGIAAAMTAFWIFYPSEERVRAAARDYRDRVLEALDAGVLDK